MDLLSELRLLIVRHAGGGPRQRVRVMDGASVSIVDAPTPPVAVMSQYLVVSVDLPVIGQALEASPGEPFVAFAMTLEPAAIAPLLLETTNTARPPG